ncbi:MAG TPA: hypothetical protein VI776_03850 [Anaerolineales bacterium]|nr:hypothetical protein [Anaerolineales bacterium]
MNILFLIIGGLLLVLGRKLFWLLVSVLGFLAGFYFAGQALGSDLGWLVLLVAIAAGIAGALIAIFLQGVAIGLAGFLGGGVIALNLLQFLGMGEVNFAWLAFIFGGILGVILIGLFFDWALILLSSVIGAFLIANAVEASQVVENVLFFALVLSGIAIQAGIKRKKK